MRFIETKRRIIVIPAIKVQNSLWLTEFGVLWVYSSVTDNYCNVVSCSIGSDRVVSCRVEFSLVVVAMLSPACFN